MSVYGSDQVLAFTRGHTPPARIAFQFRNVVSRVYTIACALDTNLIQPSPSLAVYQGLSMLLSLKVPASMNGAFAKRSDLGA